MHAPSPEQTQDLYDRHTHLWIREVSMSSDYTARPRVIESLGPVDSLDILDLGCGEGYLSRALYRLSRKRSRSRYFDADGASRGRAECTRWLSNRLRSQRPSGVATT